MTEMVLFGGYDPARRVGLDDCLLLTAEYDRVPQAPQVCGCV